MRRASNARRFVLVAAVTAALMSGTSAGAQAEGLCEGFDCGGGDFVSGPKLQYTFSSLRFCTDCAEDRGAQTTAYIDGVRFPPNPALPPTRHARSLRASCSSRVPGEPTRSMRSGGSTTSAASTSSTATSSRARTIRPARPAASPSAESSSSAAARSRLLAAPSSHDGQGPPLPPAVAAD